MQEQAGRSKFNDYTIIHTNFVYGGGALEKFSTATHDTKVVGLRFSLNRGGALVIFFLEQLWSTQSDRN